MGQYFLMDLERTLANGRPYFWKGNRHGYTDSLIHAGSFTHDKAVQIAHHDFDNTTVMIDQKLVFKILGKDMKTHEGTSA